jgi:glucose/mannose-6-phosphate isomerase
MTDARDPQGMLDDVLAQPAQLQDALWRVESAGIARERRSRGVVVCGMGGSAIGGDLAAAIVGDRATAPIITIRGYTLPAWVDEDTLVVCASYSGDTEETLASFEAAGLRGAPRVAVTTGGELARLARAEDVPVIGVPSGFQPRAAVVYMTVAALECAHLAGAAPPMRGELESAGTLLSQLVLDWAPDAPGDPEPQRLAQSLQGRNPIVYGGRVTRAAARRWRSQLNENAKVTAFYGELPEAHHNEVIGWHHAEAPFTAVLLESSDEHARLARRFDLTAEILAGAGLPAERVRARGDNPAARVLSLVLLGDLVSVYLARLRGQDPTPVDEIDALKRRLG